MIAISARNRAILQPGAITMSLGIDLQVARAIEITSEFLAQGRDACDRAVTVFAGA